MEEKIFKIDSITQYNDFFGFETKHPLVSLVDFNAQENMQEYMMTMNLFAVFLKDTKGCVINYGKTTYDYDDRSIVCFAPGQTIGISRIEGKKPTSTGLLFHPDFIHRTSLAQKMQQYTFFSYSSNEALHLSTEERLIILDCFNKIRMELNHAIDKHTKELIATNIELLLDYCLRYYDRQFITRDEINVGIMSRFERLLDGYLFDGTAEKDGLPSVKYFADKVCLSANYFGDLVKKETGNSAQDYIQTKMIYAAKERLLDSNLNVSQIAYSLGFQYPQHFIRFFKRQVGCTPKEFIMRN